MPSTKAARGGIFSGVFQQGRQGTSQGQEDFELGWYLFFQQKAPFGFESLSPLAPSSAILQAIDRIDPNELDSSNKKSPNPPF